MLGSAPRRSAGSSALVTRTTPSTFDSNISRQRVLVGLGERFEPERAAGAVDDCVDPRQPLGERLDRVRVGDVEAERRARRPPRRAASQRSSRRAAATVSQPAAASARTVASPIPLEAPVTSATLPSHGHAVNLVGGQLLGRKLA